MAKFASLTAYNINGDRITGGRTILVNDVWVLRYEAYTTDPVEAAIKTSIYYLNHKAEDNIFISVSQVVGDIDNDWAAAANTVDVVPLAVVDPITLSAIGTKYFNKQWVRLVQPHPLDTANYVTMEYQHPDFDQSEQYAIDGAIAAVLVILNT